MLFILCIIFSLVSSFVCESDPCFNHGLEESASVILKRKELAWTYVMLFSNSLTGHSFSPHASLCFFTDTGGEFSS